MRALREKENRMNTDEWRIMDSLAWQVTACFFMLKAEDILPIRKIILAHFTRSVNALPEVAEIFILSAEDGIHQSHFWIVRPQPLCLRWSDIPSCPSALARMAVETAIAVFLQPFIYLVGIVLVNCLPVY